MFPEKQFLGLWLLIKIIAMYAQGMTVRETKAFLEEQYKVEISADLIST
jgi:putative transposase